MGLKIIAGRGKTGKSTYIYDEINSYIKKQIGRNLILIVPEQMTYQTEYEIIDRFNNYGIMDVEILSFKRLAYKVFEEVGGLKVQEINNYGKIMLLKQTFEENINELQMFKKASKQDGFLREFEHLIKELKQNCISIEFIKNINKYKIENELLKRKLADIIKIYDEINCKTEGRFYDEEDKMDLFISSIEKSSYIKNSVIWIDGFDSFYGQRYKVINNLIKYSNDVSISLNIDVKCLNGLENFEDWESFKTTYDTYKIITEEIEEVKVIPIYGCKNASYEIQFLEKNLFTVNEEKFIEKTDNIKIYSSMNPYTETEKTASKIVSLVRDYGYRWRDISIAVGDIDSYSNNIKKVFTQYEIPYFLDAKRDIMDNPFTKYVLSILDMFIWNFKHDNVFEYLKTGFSPINYNEMSKLENFALQYGIEGGKWFRDFKFKAKNIGYYNELRRKTSEDFIKERKEFKELSNALDITMFLFAFIKKHKIQEKIEKQVEVFKKTGLYEKSSEHAQVWNSVIELFDQITLVGSDVEMTPKEYRKMIEAGFREVKISVIPPTLDKVAIGGMDRISFRKSKALFIIGANEGKLESKSNEKGLLLDDERDVLVQSGMKLISSSSFATYKEKHTLYRVFSSPTDKLYISYALGTVEGRPMQVSTYVDRLKQLFPMVKEETDLSNIDEINYISNATGTIEQVVLKLRDYMEGRVIDDIWKDVYSWYEKNHNDVFDVITNGIIYDNKVDKIQKEYVEKIYKNPVSMTVSKIENFAECPFKYFMETVVKPKPRYVQKVEFYDLGNIYHRAVEEFTNEISIKKIDINNLDKADILNLSQMCTEKVLLEKEQENTALEANERNKYMKNKIKRLVNRASYTIIEQLKRGNFRPEFTELKIGSSSSSNYIAPVEIKISDEYSIYLQGRIDRVDTMEKNDKSYINIIDYKSSQKDIDLSDAVQGLQLQLLVYLSSVMKNGENIIKTKPEIGGAYYFCIDDPLVDGDNLSGKCAEDEIFKKLSLKGYVLEELDVIYNMDNQLEDAKTSDIIPVAFNKDGNIKKTSKTLSKEEYRAVLNKTDEVTKGISKKILDGEIDIKPYKKDLGNKTPCTYCDYSAVCQFDVSIHGNNYRKITKQSKEEILFDMLNKGGDSSNGMD
ncbi:ATP-dependent helicase/nuclease subunit B [Sedimentibacter acidaminivorans]|uniref:ATP-dependent helicase/nuclease subunit B n=1 Tax=Sedimentibacter acidaminivorans TaxID=913099 RepID=A0ABS4GEG4_9FIRM|nr:helicase-exonuclease AddAB subunit AddB [Sedimentibacter acidaminivorans]MBP1926086.1 ATP-dependent helicase/nuclease subunit B [Sedimentibacter acidaminivorans]